jgi:hypothetical protein
MRVNMLTPERERSLRQTVDNCAICVQVGRPTPSRNVSPARVVAEFNQAIHVDFMFISLQNVPLTLFHIVDSSTAYSTAHIVPSRDLDHAAQMFESQSISAHGAPSSLAADPEFARTGFKNLLAAHHILYAESPARIHQKTGRVERKNGVLRPILYRIALADSSSPLFVIVALVYFVATRSSVIVHALRSSSLGATLPHSALYPNRFCIHHSLTLTTNVQLPAPCIAC